MMNIEELEKNMSFLASIYQKGQQLDFYGACNIGVGTKRYYQKELKHDVDQILNTLPWMLSVILCNDYLKPVEEDWWTYFYDAGKYYRLKNIAIQTFFHCLYT